MEEYKKYAAKADTIKIEDITSCERKQDILYRLKDESLNELFIYNKDGVVDDNNETSNYVPDNVEELNWLGYYIGQSKTLQKLHFYEEHTTHMYNSRAEPFFMGLQYNRSIKEVYFDGFAIGDGSFFAMIGMFFKNNDSLHKIQVDDCQFRDKGAISQFSTALGECNKSLKAFGMGIFACWDE